MRNGVFHLLYIKSWYYCKCSSLYPVRNKEPFRLHPPHCRKFSFLATRKLLFSAITFAAELAVTGAKDSGKTPSSCNLNCGTNGALRLGVGIYLVKACLFDVTLHNYIYSRFIITCPMTVFGFFFVRIFVR